MLVNKSWIFGEVVAETPSLQILDYNLNKVKGLLLQSGLILKRVQDDWLNEFRMTSLQV
jgi:hypothetical protein